MNSKTPRVTYDFTQPIKPGYSVIAARYGEKWVFVRHRQRRTWEIPGGHIEPGESPLQAAERELFEETGADSFTMFEIGPYGVVREDSESHGILFFAQVRHFSAIPHNSEMAELIFADTIPVDLTYPEIQPALHKQAINWLGEYMTAVYFIRHAQPDYSVRDDSARPLTEEGFAAAEALAEKLFGVKFNSIYSSPYKRAADTVKPLADRCGLGITFVDGLRERRIDGGVWIEDFDAFSRRQWEDLDYRLENGESLRQVQSRNIAALKMILSAEKGKAIAIGTHGTALSTILNYYDAAFGYDEFIKMKDIMPYVVKLELIGMELIGMDEIV